MRQIKFRGKSIETKEWVYGDLLQYRVLPVIFDEKEQQHECESIGQFINLLDKNNKEIYEGDIVAFPYVIPMGEIGDKKDGYDYYGIIKFMNGSYILKPIKANDGFWGNIPSYLFSGLKVYVIGNKFDNPELLKINEL